MPLRQCRAVADRDDGRARQALRQQPVEVGLGGIVERGGGFVEQQDIRPLQQRAGDGEALLLAERQHPVPVILAGDVGGERRQPDGADRVRHLRRIDAAVRRRIGDRAGERSHREIRPLRHRHQPRPRRQRDAAARIGPDAGDGAEQRRLAGAGRAGEQHPLAGRDGEMRHGHQSAAIRQRQRHAVERNAVGACRVIVTRNRSCLRRRRRGRALEAGQTVDHRFPVGDVGIGPDEERHRLLHIAERRRRLHDDAELHRAGEIGGRHHDVGKHHGRLVEARAEERQFLLPRHDRAPVTHDIAEPVHQPLRLGRLAAQERDLLAVLARAHQIEAEVRFVALLEEGEADQRPADQMREQGTEHRIDQRRPDQIAGNAPRHAEQMQRGCFRQAPQDHHEGEDRHDRVEERKADAQRAVGEQPQILGDALVRVVGGIADQLHAVVAAARQPCVEIAPRHEAAPADLQPLIEIELVDLEHDVAGGEHAEIAELADEHRPVAILQCVVEAVVPAVHQHGQADDAKLDGDQRREQDAAGPAVLGMEIGRCDPPDGGEGGQQSAHGELRNGAERNESRWRVADIDFLLRAKCRRF